MTILSWNYDAQFELSYSGYSTESRYIPFLWKELNVLNKTYASNFNPNADFAMIKLNGTAFFSDMRYKDKIFGSGRGGRDCFWGTENARQCCNTARILCRQYVIIVCPMRGRKMDLKR